MNTIEPGAHIALLREQGVGWSEIGQRLGTTQDAARGTYRRYVARGNSHSPSSDHPLAHPPASPGGAAGGVFVTPPVLPGGPDRDGHRASASPVKGEIEMARAAIAKVTRTEIRLKHSVLADQEINEVLAQRLRDFDIAIQSGVIPSIAMRVVTD